ncbi:hypothetical protein G3I20_04415 [Streptomyces sp. SID8111]|uniref:hypothetical protein n=1 Tax=Streptomyces sp. SID8111 TaxID=2706100 RepID=UPI0013C1D030|nr:hypothetical protein [Streptomyces sp. SID8111]NEC25830.1 hypothetical protein [Streptomyces sp. SID8111]
MSPVRGGGGTTDGRSAWLAEMEEKYLSPTFALIEGASLREVIDYLRCGTERVEMMSAEEAVTRIEHGVDLVGLGSVREFVFAVEAIGMTFAVPAVLRDLSKEGRCLSLTLGNEGVNSLRYAVGGDVVAYEQDAMDVIAPLRPNDERWNPLWNEALAGFRREQATGEHLLMLTEKITGVAPEASWISEPLATVRVPSSRFSENPAAWDDPRIDHE